jgi:predicted RNA binding protein YcfA (HicA-like mRNA interferase family)
VPPKNREIEVALRLHGFVFKVQVGSHKHFEHPVLGIKVTIVGDPGDEMRTGTLHRLLKIAGIPRRPSW